MSDAPTKKARTFTRLRLADIRIDPAWNCRSQGWLLASGGPDEDGGIEGLMFSIERDGQDNPVIVVPREPNGTAETYELVAGFRRAEAIRRLAEKHRNPDPTILAFVRQLPSAVDRRVTNLRENTSRESLAPSDLAFGIYELSSEFNLKNEDIAQRLGVSPQWTSTLTNIMRRVKPEITKLWRESTVNVLTVHEMQELAGIPRGEQDEAFRRMVAERNGGSTEKGGRRPWVEGARKRAEKIGELVGVLERNGMVSGVSIDWADAEVWRELGFKTKGVRSSQIESVGKAAERAYEAAIGRGTPEEAAEEG